MQYLQNLLNLEGVAVRDQCARGSVVQKELNGYHAIDDHIHLSE